MPAAPPAAARRAVARRGHAHLLAGGGYLGDAIVHYGLGNLVVAVARGPATTSGVLMVTIAPDDRTSIAWRPAVLRDGVASAVNGSGASSATRAWEDLRGCTDLQPSHGTDGSRI